uniref:SH3 domain-containing protein n=1 Tax=Hirondellea gigas TaxID=1518452 RepID=A0A6A7G0U9_9CRUS
MVKRCAECGTEALPHFQRCKECGAEFPSENDGSAGGDAAFTNEAKEGVAPPSPGAQSSKKKNPKLQKIKDRMKLPGQIKQSRMVIERFIHPKYIKGDKMIPLKLLRQAQGIAIISQVKAGFIFSGILGTGIIVARLPNGEWSGPSSIGTGGVGWGALVGASKTDSVIILNTANAVKCFSGQGQIRLGADIGIAAGPVGRDINADIGVGTKGVAPAYSYSHSKGLYAGISLQGVVISARNDDNRKFYGEKVSPEDILSGKYPPPANEELTRFYDLLKISDAEQT